MRCYRTTHGTEPALGSRPWRYGTQAYSAYFGSVAAGSPLAILDTAASWTSHYPPLPAGTRVAVHGLNAQELAANGAATEVAVGDLNKDPTLPYTDGEFDVVTNAASIAYLTRPRELFAEVQRVLKPGHVQDTCTTGPRHVHQALAVCGHLEKWIEQDRRRASLISADLGSSGLISGALDCRTRDGRVSPSW